jgi:hypothetical protein
LYINTCAAQRNYVGPDFAGKRTFIILMCTMCTPYWL